MNVKRFALGLRFDLSKNVTQEFLWREIFSVLTTSDVKGLSLYGSTDEDCYVCAIADGKLGAMRRIYSKLSLDQELKDFLNAEKPYIQTNALLHLGGLTFYGRVARDGEIVDGEGLYGIRVERVKRRRFRRKAD